MKIIPHSFTKYELTPEEFKAGAALTESNRALIQNLIAAASEEKIQLILDEKEIIKFASQDAYLRGQIDILQHLLSLASTLAVSSNLSE